MNELSRRAVLGAGVTTAALGGGVAVNAAVNIVAKAETPETLSDVSDPIFALIQQWRDLFDAIEARPCGHTEIEQRWLHVEVSKLNDLEDRIFELPFTTAAGMAAAVRFLLDHVLDTQDFCPDSDGAFLRRVADAIERQAVQA